MRWWAELVVPCTLEVGFNLEEYLGAPLGVAPQNTNPDSGVGEGSRECSEARICHKSGGVQCETTKPSLANC